MKFFQYASFPQITVLDNVTIIPFKLYSLFLGIFFRFVHQLFGNTQDQSLFKSFSIFFIKQEFLSFLTETKIFRSKH